MMFMTYVLLPYTMTLTLSGRTSVMVSCMGLSFPDCHSPAGLSHGDLLLSQGQHAPLEAWSAGGSG